MLGILVQLAVSWLLVWFFEKSNLNVLGFFPTKRRLFDFSLFFIITSFFCASGFFMKMYFADQQWKLNPDFSFSTILSGTWWNIKSVLFEELIFRGVLFYILIKKLGSIKAIIISSVVFGMYHWFSQGSWGNIQQMVFTFLITGAMGLLLAYGYAKSYSLYIPIAIHLGWNLTQSVVFSEGNIGNQLLVQVKPVLQVELSYLIFFCILLLPMVSMLLINYYLIQKRNKKFPFIV